MKRLAAFLDEWDVPLANGLLALVWAVGIASLEPSLAGYAFCAILSAATCGMGIGKRLERRKQKRSAPSGPTATGETE